MNINKQVVIQGKTIKVQLEGSGSISTFYGKMNVDKIKERENIVWKRVFPVHSMSLTKNNYEMFIQIFIVKNLK